MPVTTGEGVKILTDFTDDARGLVVASPLHDATVSTPLAVVTPKPASCSHFKTGQLTRG